MRYYYISIRTCKIKRLTTPSAGDDVEQLELSCTVGENIKFQALWKTVEQFLEKLYDPTTLLLGYLPKGN